MGIIYTLHFFPIQGLTRKKGPFLGSHDCCQKWDVRDFKFFLLRIYQGIIYDKNQLPAFFSRIPYIFDLLPLCYETGWIDPVLKSVANL